MRKLGLSGGCILLLALALGSPIDSLSAQSGPAPIDEAQLAGRSEASFPQASEDFFHDMDNGVQLTPEQVRGRNMWLVWTGGNDRFWDKVTKDTLATFDLLKVVTSHPSQNYCDGKQCDRNSRWHWLGAVNEPCFEKPTGPDPERSGFGSTCAGELRARSVRGRDQVSWRQDRRPRHDVQGRLEPAGRLVFRIRHRNRRTALVSKSGFRSSGEGQMGPRALLHRSQLLQRPDLVRPYRVGMSCGFCHVGPSPMNPPADPEHPQWANLSSTVGAQYIWIDRIFDYSAEGQEFRVSVGAILSRRARWTRRWSRPTTSTTRAP